MYTFQEKIGGELVYLDSSYNSKKSPTNGPTFHGPVNLSI